MPAAVRAERLSKRFGSRVVLNEMDFVVEAGQAALLVGDNGSGKTTLLRILATLTRPTAGRVLLGSEDSQAEGGAAARRLLGYVAHAPLVYDDLTGLENLVLAARAAGLSARGAGADARAWMTRLGLSSRAVDRAGTYSRGMKQKLALARALVVRPSVLLLDEPAAGLDETSRATLLEVLKELRGHVTVLLATHEASVHADWADRVLRLGGGRIVEASA